MRIILQFALVLGIAFQPLIACRLWAICTKPSLTLPTISIDEKDLIVNELNTLYLQSQYAPNGWALLNYDANYSGNIEPVHRSAIPALDDSTDYWNHAFSLFENGSGKVSIGHIRAASSGAGSIPNPHPWMFYKDNISFSLVHNGTVDKDLLYNLITNHGADLSWLNQHEPQTFGNGDWQNEGWSSVVDSELILLFIMQQIANQQNTLEGLKKVFTLIIGAGVNESQLNTIFSDGSYLYVFGGNNGIYFMESDEHFAIMSQPPDMSENGINWTGIQNGEMIVVTEDGITNYPNFIFTEIENPVVIPQSPLVMHAAFPNPFNHSMKFLLDLNTTNPIQINIFSMMGHKIRSQILPAFSGSQWVFWDGKSDQNKTVPSGPYFIKVDSRKFSKFQKILFIK